MKPLCQHLAGCLLLPFLILTLSSNFASGTKNESAAFVTCTNQEETFLCDANKKCIDRVNKCNGVEDCPDGADENGCHSIFKCEGEDMFKCKSSEECISKYWVCDDEPDCSDKSDEHECDPFRTKEAPCTEEDNFRCKGTGLCLPSFWECDGQADCLDGSDESDCQVNSTPKPCDSDIMFTCHTSGNCIPHRWVCDGSIECPDGSDESNCTHLHDVSDCLFDAGWFLCADRKKCLNNTLACDGNRDCDDGSDEGGKCDEACKGLLCSQGCQSTPSGGQCKCPKGFQSSENTGKCEDINECAEYGKCSQDCFNTEGSYQCSCRIGYTETEHGSCRALHHSPILLFSTKTEIRSIELHGDLRKYLRIATDVNGSKEAIGVGYDGVSQKVYWSAIKDGHEGIMSSRIDGTGQEYLLQDDSLSMIEDISVDYLGQNIYFTESKKRFIGVVGIRSKGYAYLFEEKVDKPRAIVVYPEKALLFYTDWGESPAVVRAHMDGSERESIVVTNLKWPNGITVDIAHDRIYWSDAMFNTLESSKMDGSDRRTVVETIAKHPFSLAVFEDTLYWSDWQSREIQSCNKYTGKNLTTLVKEAKVVPYGLFIYHPLLEPFSSNPCANNFCSHLCLLAPRGNYACYCPGNMTLGRDRLTCEAQLPPSPPPPPPPRTGGKDAEDSIDPRAITNGVTRLSSTTPKPQNPRIFPLDNSGDEARTFAEEGRRPPVTTEKQTPTPTPRTSSVIPPIRSSSEVPENSAAVYDKDWAKKTPIDESGSDVEGLIVGLIVLFAIVLLIAVAIFYFIRRRRSSKPPVALRFRNPTFRHGRLPSGAEELKHVEVVRKHSDGSFQSFAPPGGLHPSQSFHEVNLEWNAAALGEDPKRMRSASNPNILDAQQHGRLAAGCSSSIGISEKSDLDKASSARSGEGSPPNQSSMEEDEDEIDVYTAGQIGDKARLIH